MTASYLIQKLEVEPLSEGDLEVLFETVVESLGSTIGLKLGFDVQENSSVGFARCIAYELEPTMGKAAIKVMSFIGIFTNADCPIIADVLLFSQGSRLCRSGARTGEFMRFVASKSAPTTWTSEGWLGDEHGQYEQYLRPLE